MSLCFTCTLTALLSDLFYCLNVLQVFRLLLVCNICYCRWLRSSSSLLTARRVIVYIVILSPEICWLQVYRCGTAVIIAPPCGAPPSTEQQPTQIKSWLSLMLRLHLLFRHCNNFVKISERMQIVTFWRVFIEHVVSRLKSRLLPIPCRVGLS